MAPKFGTSGLRGLVVDLTETCVSNHVYAFLRACPAGAGLYVGYDLRPSSPDIAAMVRVAAQRAGIEVTDCGAVPTPALALAAMAAGAAAIMVTGSHIPADRNGLKFYVPSGEISKMDEAAIVAALDEAALKGEIRPLRQDPGVNARYAARYLDAFGPALQGMRIGLYMHSAIGRDFMAALLQAMGAEVTALGRAQGFVPVDTEAVAPQTRQDLQAWAVQHRLDAIVSTDADGDRPLLADEAGRVVPGDCLGQLTAAYLQAETVVTPISSNSSVLGMGAAVRFTKIGSPYVIAQMQAAAGRVAGYEANGGFLLGYPAQGPAGPLAPLMTRDAILPLVAVLAQARAAQLPLSQLVSAACPRVTAADRLQEVPTSRAQALIARLTHEPAARDDFVAQLQGTVAQVDLLDGLRMTLQDTRIVHLRPSGNAPELRLYVEASSQQEADQTLAQGLALLRRSLSTGEG